MNYEALFNPRSIVIVGASADHSKVGGKILHSIRERNFPGALFCINPKVESIDTIPCPRIEDLPDCDLAILSVPAVYCEEYVRELAEHHGVKGFIILSAGFSETGKEGAEREQRIVSIVKRHGASLIGPNCTGILTSSYAGIFAGPLPPHDPKGIDFVSGSGATAAFTVEQSLLQGLTFSSIITVGNSAEIGIEEILAYWDETFDPAASSRVKMIYTESIKNADLFYRHAASLRLKGCSLIALKSGTSEAGQRAASSHTGALSSPDEAISALFRKAGVLRCRTREEMIQTAVLCRIGLPDGRRVAVITHAGGPGVMLTDMLSRRNFSIPELSQPCFHQLRERLHPGSSVKNPIDFLATGSAEQLSDIITTVTGSGAVDAAAVIFGSPGLKPVDEVYQVIGEAMRKNALPLYPIFPSPLTAGREMRDFTDSTGLPFFTDESLFGSVLTEELPVYYDAKTIGSESKHFTEGTYLSSEEALQLLRSVEIPVTEHLISSEIREIINFAASLHTPAVLKCVGPLHKSEAGGVVLNISEAQDIEKAFTDLMHIDGAKAVEVQPMVTGEELFIGVVKEPGFGHLIFCGIGGIFIEVLKDSVSALAPAGKREALDMLRRLKSWPLFTGVRGREPVDPDQFAELIVNISHLVEQHPEILELDLNPIIAQGRSFRAVDWRIKRAVQQH